LHKTPAPRHEAQGRPPWTVRHTPHGPGLGAPADTTHAANHGGKTPCAHAPHQAAPTYTRAQAAAPVAEHAPTGNADPTAIQTIQNSVKAYVIHATTVKPLEQQAIGQIQTEQQAKQNLQTTSNSTQTA